MKNQFPPRRIYLTKLLRFVLEEFALKPSQRRQNIIVYWHNFSLPPERIHIWLLFDKQNWAVYISLKIDIFFVRENLRITGRSFYSAPSVSIKTPPPEVLANNKLGEWNLIANLFLAELFLVTMALLEYIFFGPILPN